MTLSRGFAVAAFALASLLTIPGSSVRASDSPSISASVSCVRTASSTSGLPDIAVTIDNESGAPVEIAYLAALGMPPDPAMGLEGLNLAAPQIADAVHVADGDSLEQSAPWNGGELKRSSKIVALIVTNAGILLPGCGDAEPASILLGKAGIGDETEQALVAAVTIGQLESWRAYPALYALLHPDARAELSYPAMACWYAKQFGPPASDGVKTIYSTTVNDAKLVDWSWSVTGTTYNAAEIAYQQTIGASQDEAKAVDETMHLVNANGLWSWFLGSSRDAIAAMPTDCGLPETL